MEGGRGRILAQPGLPKPRPVFCRVCAFLRRELYCRERREICCERRQVEIPESGCGGVWGGVGVWGGMGGCGVEGWREARAGRGQGRGPKRTKAERGGLKAPGLRLKGRPGRSCGRTQDPMPRSRSQFLNPFFQLPIHGFRPHVFQFPTPHFPVPESALLFPSPHSYDSRIHASGFRIPISQSARPVSESCFFGFRLRVCSFRILVFRFPNPGFRIRALQFPNSRAQFPNQFSSFRIRARRVFAVGPCQNAASDLRRCLGFQQSCATTCPAPADAGSKRHRLLGVLRTT